jgi:dTDP-4-dehydrorhamnose reductase
MKILTLGTGFVSDHLPYPVISDRLTASETQISALLDKYTPDVLINCIGRTGMPNVDWCENNKESTALANTIIPTIFATECAKRNIHFIHIGSGCIFYGNSPHMVYGQSQIAPYNYFSQCTGWEEEDFANPESYYSKTKFSADLLLGKMSNVSILRVRMPISEKNNSRNLLNKLRQYSKVIDIPNSMTFMDDFVKCIDWAAKNSKTGIYHVTNPGTLTAAQIMNEYKKYVPEHQFSIIDENTLGSLTIAKRSNCLLNSNKLKAAGFTMTPAIEALKICMNNYVKNI